MVRTVKFQCPDCKRKLAPVDALDHATQIVKRTCRCGAKWQIKVRLLGTRQLHGQNAWFDEGEFIRREG